MACSCCGCTIVSSCCACLPCTAAAAGLFLTTMALALGLAHAYVDHQTAEEVKQSRCLSFAVLALAVAQGTGR